MAAHEAAGPGRSLPGMAEFVRLDVDNGVGTIRLDRPKMNALDAQVQRELIEVAQEADTRADVAAVVIYGGERVFALLHRARPVLLNLSTPGALQIAPWADRVRLLDARYDGGWELPALGAVSAPAAVLIRPDGYVAWVGDGSDRGLRDALTRWFGPPAPRRD